MKKLVCYLGIIFSLGIVNVYGQLPIKPERTISFETDEGSYMNLSISPDGKTLLFDLLGDIYSLPVEGGKATQLTRGLALHMRPFFSPDGRQMAYLSDGAGSMKMHVSNLDGTGERVVGNEDFRPFGKKEELDERYGDLPGGGVVSANGKFVAYVFKPKYMVASLMLRNLETGKERKLVSPLVLSDSTAGYDQKFCFSPDSKYIYISYGGKIHRISTETGSDEIIPFAANVNSDLGKLNYHTFPVSQKAFNSNYVRGGMTSPDGKTLYFVAFSKLYRMSLPNGKPVMMAAQDMGQFQPTVSPDGKWIAYVGWNDRLGGSLWKVPSQGGKAIRLTAKPGHYQQPSWSPDGKKVAVVMGSVKRQEREDSEFGKLQLVVLNDRKVFDIADKVPLWNSISFSGDGNYVKYRVSPKAEGSTSAADAGVHPVVVAQHLATGEVRVLANGELDVESGGDSQISLYRQHQQLSPDEKFMVYAEQESLFLVPVEKNGQVPMIYGKTSNPNAIRFAMGMDPYFEDGGKTICWTFGNRFFKVRTEKIVETAERSRIKRKLLGLPNEEYSTAEVVPDQEVKIKVEMPAFYGNGTIVLKNVRILTMNGDEVIENGTILVRDGRIVSFGNKNKVLIPKGATEMDLSGKTVMPGMVDVHLHIRGFSNLYLQQDHRFLASLAYGVTTARDPYIKFDSYAISELIRAGRMLGPRFYSVGRPARLAFSEGLTRMDSFVDAQDFVGMRKGLGSVFIKQYALPTRLQRQWLLMASEEAGLNMTNEAPDWFAMLSCIKDGSAGCEHEPGRYWGDVYRDITTFLGSSGTYITPTIQASMTDAARVEGKKYFNYAYWRNPDQKLRYFLDSISINRLISSKPVSEDVMFPRAIVNARLRKSGTLMAMGSHGDDIGSGPHSELWALQMGGLSNMEALQSATIIGAKGLGMQKDLGSIEVGKIADLIILNKNPLNDIHNSREIRYVMKDGVLYDGDTLETLWPLKRPAPEWKYKGDYETLIKHSDKP